MTYTDIRDITSFKWATVTGTNPLAIKLDGDTAPLALIPDSLVDPLTLVPGDRVRVELSLRKAVVHGTAKTSRGTTTQRNARFGIPATDAERVALANRKVVWFNTDLGWEESYYATTGLTGLTAKGLLAGISSGWFPTGLGPSVAFRPTTGFAATTGNYVGNWNGSVSRRGGNSFFGGDGLGPIIKLPGMYDVNAYTVQPAGTGLADYHIRLNDDGAGTIKWQHNLSGIVLSSSYFTAIGANFQELLVPQAATPANGIRLAWFCSNGTLTLHNTSGPTGSGRGELAARYVRPPLVSD